MYKTITRILLKNLLKYFNLSFTVKLNNSRVSVPVRGGVGFENILIARHETWMNSVIETYYTGSGCFIDVGVNLGQTLIKFKTLHKQGRYIGFEPNSNCIAYLAHLMKQNNWIDLKLVSSGLAAESAILPMFFNVQDSTSNQTGATFIEGYRSQTNKTVGFYMPCLNLDKFSSDIIEEAVELIKIDVEGGELFVLQGVQKLVEKDRPIIIVEVLPANRENVSLRAALNKEINDLIDLLGYNVHEIIEGDYTFQLVKKDRIPIEKAELSNYNYLLSPRVEVEQ